jgi:hypothetical protein
MRWARYVEQMGDMTKLYTTLVEKLKGTDHLEDLGVKGSTILKWILNK